MKTMILTLLVTLPVYALPQAEFKSVENKKSNSTSTHGQVSPVGNGNITNICQPKIVVNQCDSCKKKCEKPKVIYKTKYKTKTVIKEKVVVKKVKRKPKKNRVKVLGGYGPNGVSAKTEGSSAVAYEEKGLVLGFGYDRLLDDRWSVGVQAQTNETYLLSVGYDF